MHASKSRPFKVIDFQNYLRFWCLFLPHMKSTTTTKKPNWNRLWHNKPAIWYAEMRRNGSMKPTVAYFHVFIQTINLELVPLHVQCCLIRAQGMRGIKKKRKKTIHTTTHPKQASTYKQTHNKMHLRETYLLIPSVHLFKSHFI